MSSVFSLFLRFLRFLLFKVKSMFDYIIGKIVNKTPTRLIVEAGKFGFTVLIPLSTFNKLGKIGAEVKLLLSPQIRPESWSLYGFHSEEERSIFNMLLTVAGVGPKSALAALSAMSVQQLCQAIVEGDMDRISLTPGIGKKTAQRISLELKDKVKALTIEGGELIHLQDDYEEAALALTALGYNRLQAEKAVNRVMKEGGAEKIEDIIRKALGVIAGG